MSNGSLGTDKPTEVVKTVGPAEILKVAGDVEPGTWTQRAGMRLAVGVGALAAGVTIAILVNWYRMLPQLPQISASTAPDVAQAAINNYKALNLEARDTAIQLFEAFVLRAIVPVFTSIVGFVLGVQAAAKER